MQHEIPALLIQCAGNSKGAEIGREHHTRHTERIQRPGAIPLLLGVSDTSEVPAYLVCMATERQQGGCGGWILVSATGWLLGMVVLVVKVIGRLVAVAESALLPSLFGQQ